MSIVRPSADFRGSSKELTSCDASMSDSECESDGSSSEFTSSAGEDDDMPAGPADHSDSSTLVIGGRVVHLFFELVRETANDLTLTICAYPDPPQNRRAARLILELTLDPLYLRVGFRMD